MRGCVLTASLVSLALSTTALAQVRTEARPQDFLTAANGDTARALFGRGGYFMIAGGVVLGGTAVFLKADGALVAPGSVSLAAAPGGVGLRTGGVSYALALPPGLACPLGQFVRRDGLVAYTVPKFLDPESRRRLQTLGVVRHRIAREFDGTKFETLLHAADFAAAVPLDQGTADALSRSINGATGVRPEFVLAALNDPGTIGSLINADVQVRYRVYLEPGGRAEVGGVPVRYFWQMDQAGAAGVFATALYAQDWKPGAGLTDWWRSGAAPAQIDVVNFYQAAGVFRQIHLSDPAGFSAFVDAACGVGGAGPAG